MSENRWLTVILGLYVALAFAYSWLMPPWEGPDEPAHYILAVNLARVGVFSNIEQNYEAGQPQPYYWFASVPLRLLYQIDPEWVAVIQPERNYGNVRQPAPIFFWSDDNYQFLPGLYLLRWLNILVGVGALRLNYAAMRRFVRLKSQQHLQSLPSRTDSKSSQTEALPSQAIALPSQTEELPSQTEELPSPTVPLAALALIALTPQFLHTTSSVANDTAGILAGAILWWLLSRVVFKQVSSLELGLSVILAFLLPYTTKLTVLPVSIVLGMAALAYARQRWPGTWLRFAFGGVMIGSGVLLLGVWLIPEMGKLFLQQVAWRGFSFQEDAFEWAYLWEMVKQVVWSYWGLVGWLQVGLAEWMVVLLTGLGIVGVIGAGMRNSGRESIEKRIHWVVWLVAGLAVLAVLKNGLNTINSQGRFLFPAVGALALLMMSGWENVLPVRFRGYLLPGIMVLMMGANLILWFWGIIPVYYQPFWD